MLDDYIEAHIHGELKLIEDVESLVLDPIFKATDVEQYARELGVPILWHEGFELSIETMSFYPDYRGAQFVELAKQLATDGMINARALGHAVVHDGYDEQDVKKVWHYLARFGYKGYSGVVR